jgi:hypothetical protein
MRALCGAIITAGAVIGLGLAAIGHGTRYAQTIAVDKDTNQFTVATLDKFEHVDKPLLFIIVFLTLVALTGLGIAFVGLAYHHHRRHHEMLHHLAATPHPHAQA